MPTCTHNRTGLPSTRTAVTGTGEASLESLEFVEEATLIDVTLPTRNYTYLS